MTSTEDSSRSNQKYENLPCNHEEDMYAKASCYVAQNNAHKFTANKAK